MTGSSQPLSQAVRGGLRIVIPCFNVEKYISNTILSIKSQTYSDFRVMIVDDASIDHTSAIAKEIISGDLRFNIVTNGFNQGALMNIVASLSVMCDSPDDICIVIDGDDCLASPYALEIIKHVYTTKDCLLTYGNFATQSGRVYRGGFGMKYDYRVIAQGSYRSVAWRGSHLRTFKHKLWSRVNDRDLRSPNGEYWRVTCDMAMMFPMLEMAGERQEAIPDIIYYYRDNIPSNNHNLRLHDQQYAEKIIRAMPRYQRIDEYI